MTQIPRSARAVARTVPLIALLAACGGRVGGDEPGGGASSASGSTTILIGTTTGGGSGGCVGCTVTATAWGPPPLSGGSAGSAPSCLYNNVVYANAASWSCDPCGDVCVCENGVVLSPGPRCATATAGTTIPGYTCYSSGSVGYCVGSTSYSTSYSISTSYVTTVTATAGSSLSYCYYNGYSYAEGQTWTCPDGCNECRCLSGQVWATTYVCAVVDAGIYDAAMGD